MPATIDIARPSRSEYDEYYETYVSKVPSGRILKTLEVQHRELQQRLTKLTPEQADFRYAPGKWSIKEVVGHLLDTERVFLYRALCFSRSETQPLPGMDQDQFASEAEFQSRPLRDIATEADLARRSAIAFFGGLSRRQLARTGVASNCAFTTRSLAYIIAGHERHHLEVLEKRYLLPDP